MCEFHFGAQPTSRCSCIRFLFFDLLGIRRLICEDVSLGISGESYGGKPTQMLSDCKRPRVERLSKSRVCLSSYWAGLSAEDPANTLRPSANVTFFALAELEPSFARYPSTVT